MIYTKEYLFDHCMPEPNSGCWLWMESLRAGYGAIDQDLAHRVSYELYKGPIQPGLHIDHLCRVPICINPDHLEAVRPVENWFRGQSPGAISAKTGKCQKGHDITGANGRLKKYGHRRCKQCDLDYQRALREYHILHPRPCKDCGEPEHNGRHYCVVCLPKRAKEQKARYWTKKRAMQRIEAAE